MEKLNDLLLPVVKGFGSEKSWTLLGTESLQTFGGAGFTRDWPILNNMCAMQRSIPCMKAQLQFKVLISSSVKLLKMAVRSLGLLGKEIQAFAEAGGAHAEAEASTP